MQSGSLCEVLARSNALWRQEARDPASLQRVFELMGRFGIACRVTHKDVIDHIVRQSCHFDALRPPNDNASPAALGNDHGREVYAALAAPKLGSFYRNRLMS
jgi:hypothetical protein